MRVETASEPGDPERPNEDFVAAALPAAGHGGALVVLDGVTPPPEGDGCAHGVPWFTSRLGGALLELAVSHPSTGLTDCLSEAIARTAAAHRSTCDLSHPRTPQATVVAVRWNEDDVEHLVLSDSILLLEAPDGTITSVVDARLEALPRDDTVEEHRNQEGGFFTAAVDPAVVERAVFGTTPRPRVRALAALTDGAARWVDVFGFGDWLEAFADMRSSGASSLIRRVRAAESQDRGRTAYPRGKTSDDATVAFVDLRPATTPEPAGRVPA